MSLPKDPFHYEYRVGQEDSKGGIHDLRNISAPAKRLPPEVESLGENVAEFFKKALEEAKEIDTFSEVKLIIAGDEKIDKSLIHVQLIDLNSQGLNPLLMLPQDTNKIYDPKVTIVSSNEMLNLDSDKVLKKIINDDYALIEKNTTGTYLKNYFNSPDPFTKYLVNRQNRKQGNFLATIWNFDEQKIYHGIQKLFFTKRTIYLLVVDNRNAINDIYNKILSIKSFGGSSPIILTYIQESSDKAIAPVFFELQKNFPELEIVSIKKDQKNSFIQLRRVVESLIFQNNELDQTLSSHFPRNWIDLRYEINALRRDKNFINLADFMRICDKHNIDEEAGEILLEVLHQLGVVVHFKDDNSLRDTIFLNYNWINDAIKILVNSPEVIDNQGIFNEATLSRIWNRNPYKYDVGKLLSIITKKSLAFCFELTPKKYMLPDFISINEEENTFTRQKGDLNLVLNYHPFLPDEIFNKLLVAFGGNAYNSKFWKHGMIADKDNCKIYITQEPLENKIKIAVQGNVLKEKIELLGVIRNTFHELNKDYEMINLLEEIPCICAVCSIEKSPYHFSYEALKKRMLVKSSATIECPKSFQDVRLVELIGIVDLIKKSKVNEFIAKGFFDMAIDALKHALPGNNEVIQLESKFNSNERENREGVISKDEYNLERNKIIKSLIASADFIE